MIRGSLLAIAVAGISCVQQAQAADMMLTKAPPAVPAAETWTGFYLGVHAGWGWTSNNAATASSASTPAQALPPGAFFNPLSFDVSSNGVIGGGQAGFNWQVSPSIVLGVEGDISASDLRGSQTLATSSSGFGGPPVAGIGSAFMRQNVDWLASLRGRIGYVVGPGLLYATGGAAWAGVADSANASTSVVGAGCCTFPASFNSTLSGAVVGAGYEAMLSRNWLVRSEYLFYSFGSVGGTVGPTTTTTPGTCNGFPCFATYGWGHLDVNTVRLGLSYKL